MTKSGRGISSAEFRVNQPIPSGNNNDLDKISSDIKLFADDFAYLAFQFWVYSC